MTVSQRTIKNRINCTGIGLHSGETVRMWLRPAEADTGIVFERTDLPQGRNRIPARYDHVVDTQLGTTIANEHGAKVMTVEHLMSALSGCGIDNAIVEVDGPEVPVMDGSAAPFVFLIDCAGHRELDAPRRYLKILRTVVVEDGAKSVTVSPDDGFVVAFDIDFPTPVIAQQSFETDVTASAFKADIARARTFGFAPEVEYLRSKGLARGGSLDNAIVIDGDRILNEGGLRYTDEFVRHKVLDAVGDLYLAGAPVIGHYHGVLAGHALNNRVLRAIFADAEAYAWVDSSAMARKPAAEHPAMAAAAF